MDNNFKEGNSLQDNNLPANPYAQGGIIHNLFPQIQRCDFYASFQYAVDASGSAITITPLTGNLSGDLRYYRVEVSDGQGTTAVANSLDLANRATPFVINTSTLNPNVLWKVFFYGEDGRKVADVGCSLDYVIHIDNPKSATGNSIPPVEKWDNVKFLLKLYSTTDGDFTLFPTEGVELSRNAVINMQDYSLNNGLKDSEGYEFKLFAYKVGLLPSMALPIGSSDVVSTVSNNVTFPYAISDSLVDVADIVIETATAGTFTGTLSSVLTNEGVTPSISITINTIVI